jgi:6-pyruvoyltetrahydropterin/6-carboxytetrahydropterin synthase
MISLTRRYHFPASHRLHAAQFSEAENVRIFGKCNNPFGHGHDYILEVTISGEVDAITGLLVPIARLDEFVAEKVLRLFAYRNLNVDVPQFANLVPTTENMALVIGDLVSRDWTKFFGELPIYASRIHIQETDRNGFEVLLPAPEKKSAFDERNERVMVHA